MIKISREKDTLNIYLDGQKLEQVDSFQYLRSIIADDGYCFREVIARIAVARGALERNTPFFKGNVPLSLKGRLVKCLVWSVLLKG